MHDEMQQKLDYVTYQAQERSYEVKKPEEYIIMDRQITGEGGVSDDDEYDYGLYEKDYKKKQRVWAKNEIKKVDSQFQKLNFKALT